MGQTPRPAPDAVRIGEVFLGKYRVESILGQGGMGVVAACTHLQLNERVAVKMLRQDVSLDRDATERFMREAQAAVKLKSEYVARVTDVGTLESGIPYMVMEFLEGHDLGALLVERGRLPVPWAVELVLQTCEALAEAHSLGIIHRDVKPANLFVTWGPDGSALIKVLDFGISKSSMGTDMHLTQTQSLLGTPAYMSPEQMRSARGVDGRTDMWSLGTVLYELVEGHKPFEADSFSEMCVKVAVDAPTPMVHAPPALQEVILRCLAKAPEQRFATMAELGRALVPFVQDGHQAAMLVERMQRMHRRSLGEFDVSTGVNMRVPAGIRDMGSAPVRANPQPAYPDANRRAADAGRWHEASQPSLSPWQGNTDPGMSAFRTPLPQPPAPTVSATTETPPRGRRRWPFILLGMVVTVAAGIAVGVQADSARTSEAVAPSAAIDSGSALTGSAAGSATDPGAPGVGSAVGSADPGSASTGSADAGSAAGSAAAGSAAVPELTGSAATVPTSRPSTGAGKSGKPKSGKSGKSGTGAGKVIKDPPPIERPTVTTPPKSDCIPWEHAHGCPGSRRN